MLRKILENKKIARNPWKESGHEALPQIHFKPILQKIEISIRTPQCEINKDTAIR